MKRLVLALTLLISLTSLCIALPSVGVVTAKDPTLTRTPTITRTPNVNATATREQYNANRTATAGSVQATQTQRADNRTATADSVRATRIFVAAHKFVNGSQIFAYADARTLEDIVFQGRIRLVPDDTNSAAYIDVGDYTVYVQSDNPIEVKEDDYVTVYATLNGHIGVALGDKTYTLPDIRHAVLIAIRIVVLIIRSNTL